MSFSDPVELTIQWNEDYDESWGLSDPVTLAPQDVTGWQFELQARPVAGATGTPLLSLNLSSDPLASGVYCPNPASGLFKVRIKQADLQSVATEFGLQDVVRLAFDLVVTDTTPTKRLLVSGVLVLIPGVSQ